MRLALLVGLALAGVTPVGAQDALSHSGLAVNNVLDYGAVCDGVANDTAAIDRAQLALPTSGGIVFFPAGTCLLSGTGIVLKKSNVIFRGAGMFASTVSMVTGSMVQTNTLYQVSNIAFEDLGFDGALTATNAITIGRYAVFDQFRVSRCRFWRMVNAGIALDGDARVVIEDSRFEHPGDGKSAGITMTNTAKSIDIRRNTFRWLSDGVSIDTGSTTSEVENPVEYVTIEGNYFDLGWWLLTARATGSGAGVTYTSTVLTDTGAAFSGLGLNDTVRVMPVKQTGTGTINRTKITDASATFTTNSVRRGDIVRMGTVFAVVMAVTSQTVLTVEDWLSDTDRQPIADPATGSYTIYGVYIGKRTSFTSTTLTTPRFHDFDGTAVTPSAGTLYEVLGTRPNYPLQVEYSGRKLRVINNTFKRGWSDQISVFGYEAQIIGNTIEDGEDMGITSHGQGNVIQGNTIRHQGAGGIFTTASDSVITGNVFSDTPWENAVNVTYLAHIIVSNGVQDGSRNIIANNRCLAGTVATPRYGISIYGASGNAVDANLVHDNYCTGHTTADILVRGAVATNTRLFDNTAALVVVDTSATLTAQRGSYGAASVTGCGTSPTVSGNDMAGKVLIGATPGTCVVTYKLPMNAAQNCTANNETSAVLARVTSPSATGFTISGTLTAGDTVNWHCAAP